MSLVSLHPFRDAGSVWLVQLQLLLYLRPRDARQVGGPFIRETFPPLKSAERFCAPPRPIITQYKTRILQHNKKATDKFNADQKGNVVKADQNWPGLVVRNGSGGKTLVQTDKRGVALEGYDPISYFTAGQPVKGDPKIEAT